MVARERERHAAGGRWRGHARVYDASVRLALTFDDGPGPATDPLLDVLARHRARATFFVLGKSIEEATWCGGDRARARAVALRTLREGHVVGSHGFAHLRPAAWRELAADLARTDVLLTDLYREAGRTLPAAIPVRLPYGIRLVDETVASPEGPGSIQAATLDPRIPVLASLGRTHVHWTGDFADWTIAPDAGPALAAAMIAHVERAASMGLDAVLDLHDGGTGSSWGYDRPATVAGVDLLLGEAARRGWTIFAVPVGT